MRSDRLAIIGLVATLLAATGGKGEVYDRPTAQVRDLIRTVEVPLHVFGSRTETDAVLDVSDPGKVKWKTKAPRVRNLYLVSMTEAVDPALDGRAYDISTTYPAMMSAVGANATRLFPPDHDGSGRSASAVRR